MCLNRISNFETILGTITCLTDYDGTYLFSGCDDGTICIWKKGSWMCEKTLRAHTGGVVDVSVHPSGKLALSIGKDKAMKTWNLVKGRCGYVTNLKVVADAVRWSPEGSHYAVSLSNRVDVYSLQNAKVVYSIPFGKRVSCICFIDVSKAQANLKCLFSASFCTNLPQGCLDNSDNFVSVSAILIDG